MAVNIDESKCEGCGDCVDICPSFAIEIIGGVATVDEDMCEECGACVEVCPNNAVSLQRRRTPKKERPS